jgi:hypothetical protein
METECLIAVGLDIAGEEGGVVEWQAALDEIGSYLAEGGDVDEHTVMHDLAGRAEVRIEVMEKLDINAAEIGFLHGWMVQQLIDTTDLERILEVHRRVCMAEQNRDIVGDCDHGIGHVAYQQNRGSFAEMRDVCVSLYPEESAAGRGDCYSGLFMAYGPARNEEPRQWGRTKRASWEDTVGTCRATSGEAAKRCWPWVYWFYTGEGGGYREYAETCERAGVAARWCGKGVALHEMYIRQRDIEMPTERLIATCAGIQGEGDLTGEMRIGCAVQAIELDLIQWWGEGNSTRRIYPCGVGPGGDICREALVYLEGAPCDREPDNAERVALCLRNRAAVLVAKP